METTYEAEESRAIGVEGYTHLSLKNTNGNVSVEGCDGETVALRAVKKVKAHSEEEGLTRLKAIRIVVSGEAPTLSITTDDAELKPRGKYGVDYTLRLPMRMVPFLETANGNVTVSGTSAGTSVRTRNGNVRAERIDGATVARTTNGNVHVEGIAGQVDAQTVNGNVHAVRVRGQVEAHAVNGNVRAEDVVGPAQGHTQNGNVELTRIAGPASGSSTNGNVRTALTEWKAGFEARFQTLNGNVTLDLPASVSARVSAASRSGRVRCDIPVQATLQTRSALEGVLGSGEGAIDLRTTNGGIQILATP